MTDFQKRIALKVQYYLDVARERLGFDVPVFEYDFSLKGKVGGKFNCMVTSSNRYHSQVLRFNLLMMKQDPEKYLEIVVGHEVAHMVAENMYGSFGNAVHHGNDWKHVMLVFGLEPNRTHDFDVTPETSGLALRNVKRHAAKCSCTTHMISTCLRNRMVKGRSYSCKTCNMPVRLVA